MSFLNIFKRKKKVILKFDSSDFTDAEQKQQLLNALAFMKGEEAKRISEEGKKREKESEKKDEEEKIKFLNEQAEMLKKDVSPLSLFKILKYQKNKKNKKKKIYFTSFNSEKELGEVEDFVIMPDGAFGCVSDKKVIWASKDLNHVFYWVAGLNNFAKNRIIPLSVNSEGKYQPNIVSEEVSRLVKTSDGKFKITKFDKKPLYEELADKEEDISELFQELESSENTITEQQKEIHEKNRESMLHKNRADKIQSELSMALNKVAEIEMASGQIIRQNMTLMNLKEINENLINVMEKVVEKWSGKIEEKFGKDIREAEWEELKSKLNWAKLNMPQIQYITPEKEPKPTLTELIKPEKP